MIYLDKHLGLTPRIIIKHILDPHRTIPDSDTYPGVDPARISEVPRLPAKELHLKWVCSEQGSNSFKTPEVCCVDIYYFMILYILWEFWSVASRSYILWARREGLPLSIGGQKPLTITERERERDYENAEEDIDPVHPPLNIRAELFT